MTDNSLLVIVPARGGSKGIPRKNVRLLRGRPLIAHVLETVRRSRHQPDIWVSTDDEEIRTVASRFGAKVVNRPPSLAEDEVTLDPVIHHGTNAIEGQTGLRYGIVATVQPTSPILSVDTFDAAVEKVKSGKCDTALTVVPERHLRWKEPLEAPLPLFNTRLNRQEISPEYRETGAVLVTRRQCIGPNSRIGNVVSLIPLPEHEAVDIDSYRDWWLAENYLAHSKVAIRVDGGRDIGLGHVYRAITLASRMFNHDICFFMTTDYPDGIRLIESYNFEVHVSESDTVDRDILAFQPDIVFLDILDTEDEQVINFQKAGVFVVSFEDLGSGSRVADLVFNALYDSSNSSRSNCFSGPSYVCLREEFYSLKHKEIRNQVHEVLVTFGGTDPCNLTLKTVLALQKLKQDFHITIVLGLGYTDDTELQKHLDDFERTPTVIRNTRSMSSLMHIADIAITSAGRTVYELIACHTPTIALAQNERELRHTSAHEDFGVINLGLGKRVSERQLVSELKRVWDVELRRQLHHRMLKADLWQGPDRVLGKVFHEYEARRRYEELRSQTDSHSRQQIRYEGQVNR